MEPVPFCHHNTRLWVTALIAAGVLVLAFAIWLAVNESDLQRAPTSHQGGSPGSTAGSTTAASAGASGDLSAARTVGWFSGPGPSQLAHPQRQSAPPSHHLHTSFARAADVIRPAVVNINAVRQRARPNGQAAVNGPRFVNPFDGVPDKVFGNVAYESVGSGVIVDRSGYVVTNYHLVGGATSVVITRFNQGDQHLRATIVAADERHDLALLKLRRKGVYPAADFADSSKCEVGMQVLAVGNPFGLGHTVTSGIISGRRRSLTVNGMQYKNLLQTDAPINQGSSGGPLVNLEGKVIGINTAIYAPTGVFSGTGFAIPANRVSAFVTRATAGDPRLHNAATPAAGAPLTQHVLGMSLIDVSTELATKLRLPSASGAFVTAVATGSPAADAEVTRGDVVIDLGGAPVRDSASLAAVASRLRPGQQVALTVWRGSKPRTLSLGARRPRTAWR